MCSRIKKNGENSIFFSIIQNENFFVLLVSMRADKNLNCLIGLTNCDNLVIVKFWNYKVDLKYNFVNN